MTICELVLEALHTLEVDQAGLAKRLGRSQATVSRWVSGDVTPDYESCLRLARIIGVPARQVLEAAGLDPQLVPDYSMDAESCQPRLSLDPQLTALLAKIEAGWRVMDERTRDMAERGALALFSVDDTRRTRRRRRVTKRTEGFDRPKSERSEQIPAWLRKASEHSEAKRVATLVGAVK